MSRWLDQTILPQLLQIDPKKLTGKSFWYAADDIVSESELRRKRSSSPQGDDPLIGLSGDTFNQIEKDVFARADKMMGLSPSVICYDTSNFYTYIEEPTRSELAHTCHSKAAKHHLKHVRLLMTVERSHGVPLVSNVYQANRHDSKVFSCVLADLRVALKQMCADQELVLVLDKGNNSKDNFKSMEGKISWVGSLVPSHHKDLITIPPEYTVGEAAQLLIEENISGCPVLDLDGGIVGVITKTDVLKALVASPGINPIEIVFGVQVKDGPDCINDVIGVIHKYRGGLLAVWSSYANAPEYHRNVFVRTVNVDPALMPNLERELREKFKLRFVVDRRQNRHETFDT